MDIKLFVENTERRDDMSCLRERKEAKEERREAEECPCLLFIDLFAFVCV